MSVVKHVHDQSTKDIGGRVVTTKDAGIVAIAPIGAPHRLKSTRKWWSYKGGVSKQCQQKHTLDRLVEKWRMISFLSIHIKFAI